MQYSVFISLRTNAPAPIVTLLQILIPPITLLPYDNVTLSPIVGTLLCACPTLQLAEMPKFFPIFADEFIIMLNPCHIQRPGPMQLIGISQHLLEHLLSNRYKTIRDNIFFNILFFFVLYKYSAIRK